MLCHSAEVGTAVGYSRLYKRAETMVKTGDTWQLALILVLEIFLVHEAVGLWPTGECMAHINLTSGRPVGSMLPYLPVFPVEHPAVIVF